MTDDRWHDACADGHGITGPRTEACDVTRDREAPPLDLPPVDQAQLAQWSTELKFNTLLPAPLLEAAVRARWMQARCVDSVRCAAVARAPSKAARTAAAGRDDGHSEDVG